MIEENFLKAVIGLPANLFFGTGIPAAILIFNKGKNTTDVLFIDASRDYMDEKNQNRLRDQDIEKIVATYQKFQRGAEVRPPGHARSELEGNEFNLNIPRYVDTSEKRRRRSISWPCRRRSSKLEAATGLDDVRRWQGYLKELGYGS